MDDGGFPAWTPHPDVWLVVGLLAIGYVVALVRVAPRHVRPGQPAATPLQITCFTAALVALWVSSDWPVHDLAEQRLFSVHMVQHLVEMLVVPPLLLLGTPAWLARALLPPRVLRIVRWWARFVPATLLFNAALLFAHAPVIVDLQLSSGAAHASVHGLLVVASTIAWLPVLSPLPEVPRLQPPLRMLYLFCQGIVPTVPASFLTFGDRPLYRVYEDLPTIWNVSAIDDMRVGGLVMKLVGGIILWVLIAIVFFRWYGEEEREAWRPTPSLRREDVDRELERMGTAQR